MSQDAREPGAGEAPTPDRLRAAVLRLVEACAVDTTPDEAGALSTVPSFLPSGARIYAGQPPGTRIERIVELVERLSALGYEAIPQLAVRELASEAELRGALERFARIGIGEALIVAGDRAEPAGPYDSTIGLLGTGVLAEYGITTIGVAGYPEGNRIIGPTVLAQALAEKADLAAACGWQLYVVTQLSFDASATVAWIERSVSAGIRLPMHVGLPGLGSLRELIGYSRRCGVGASMRALVAKASSLPDSTALATTADLLLRYARATAMRPELPIEAVRFFTFAGLADTAEWIGRIRSGRFTIEASADGLRLAT